MKKNTFLLLIGATLLVVIAIGAYASAYSLVSTKSADVASLAVQISQKTQATTDIAAAKAELTALQSEEGTVNQYFISTSDVVPFLEQLATTGKYLGTNVQVLSVSATPPAAGVPYGHLNLSVSITGTFDSVLRTLGAIEYGPEDTTVLNVTFNAAGGVNTASSSPTWTANAVYMIGAKNDIAKPTSQSSATAATTTPAVIPAVPVTTSTTTALKAT